MTNAGSKQQTSVVIFDQVLQQAAMHHQAGRYAEAEEIYRSILQVDPGHPEANHNLGLAVMQLGKAELHYLQTAWEGGRSLRLRWPDVSRQNRYLTRRRSRKPA